MATKIEVGLEKPAERIKAFELYITAAADGKRRSFRSIAMELGVHETTVKRWYDNDDWAEKTRRMLDTTANTEETVSQHIRRLIRHGLIDGLRELGRLTCEADKDQDKIAATVALANIAGKMDAISSGAGGEQKDKTRDIQFKDDLPVPVSSQEPPCPVDPSNSDSAPTDGTSEPKTS
jgi:hypothetical protein